MECKAPFHSPWLNTRLFSLVGLRQLAYVDPECIADQLVGKTDGEDSLKSAGQSRFCSAAGLVDPGVCCIVRVTRSGAEDEQITCRRGGLIGIVIDRNFQTKLP